MQSYDQSDQDTEAEGVSSAASEPAADDYYNEEGEDEDDEYNDDWDENTHGDRLFSGDHSFFNDHVDPKLARLATLLNGPQWKPANPDKRRTAKVDYNEKKLAQAPTRNPKQAAKVRKKC
jgi:hypothetical protein